MLHITSFLNNAPAEIPLPSPEKLASIVRLLRRSIIPVNSVLCSILAFEAWQRYRYSDITEPKLWSAIIPISKLTILG